MLSGLEAMEAEAMEELMKLSYEEWAAIAYKQYEAEGDMTDAMTEVAAKKGDWLNRWHTKEGKSDEAKQARKRGRRNTIGDLNLAKSETLSEPGGEWQKTEEEDFTMPQQGEEPAEKEAASGR